MTINPDLERELALVVERESLAVAVRVLRLLVGEVQRLDNQLEARETLESERDLAALQCIAEIMDRLDLLEQLHTNARPGHGYATMAGEHSTPVGHAKE